jgi:hypothetical protein
MLATLFKFSFQLLDNGNGNFPKPNKTFYIHYHHDYAQEKFIGLGIAQPC